MIVPSPANAPGLDPDIARMEDESGLDPEVNRLRHVRRMKMAEEAKGLGQSEEQREADEFAENSRARHPVIAAAEEKLAAMEAGERMDVQRHQEIRHKHLGDAALSPEQRATGEFGEERPDKDA